MAWTGMTNDVARDLVRRGILRRLHRGVYAISGAPETWLQQVMAAVLACGEHAYASHATAARIWGYPGFPPTPIETTVPLPRVVRLPGIRAHRSGTLRDEDLRVVDGIPTLSAARTLVDLSARLDDTRLGELVDEGLRRRVVTLSSLRAVARRLATIAPGRSPKRIERVLSARLVGYHPGDSELETHVLRVLLAGGLPEPERQFRVVVGARTYFLDLAYPASKIAIEVDGFDFHRGRTAFDHDRLRQNDLVAAGWTVLRFTSTSTDAEILDSVRALVFVR